MGLMDERLRQRYGDDADSMDDYAPRRTHRPRTPEMQRALNHIALNPINKHVDDAPPAQDTNNDLLARLLRGGK